MSENCKTAMSLTNTPSSSSSSSSSVTTVDNNNHHHIPVEVISDEEMAFIEAALLAARSTTLLSPKSALFPPRTPPSTVPARTAATASDIEDAPPPPPPPRKSPSPSLFRRFRRRGYLSVTDLTASEWCEKQMEFSLTVGRPERTKAMTAGSKRHTELEKEVISKVYIPIKSHEDKWAIDFLNFIAGVNQLLSEGITRELFVVGILEGLWFIGLIDEIRLPMVGPVLNPVLVDTKTRSRATLPSEPQKRNARLQLMCYKYLWDNIATSSFPTDEFFKHFDLNPQQVLFDDVKSFSTSLGFQHKTLGDVVKEFHDIHTILSESEDQLLLRYELQGDRVKLGEFKFAYDQSWLRDEVKRSLEFWFGEREADYVSRFEEWKCNFCHFTDKCPRYSNNWPTEK